MDVSPTALEAAESEDSPSSPLLPTQVFEVRTFWSPKLMILKYTLARIAANMVCLTWWYCQGEAGPFESYFDEGWFLAFECQILRPVMNAAFLDAYFNGNFRPDSPIHVWSRRLCFLMAASVGFDSWCWAMIDGLSGSLFFSGFFMLGVAPIQLGHLVQMHLANLKLHALGYERVRQICRLLLVASLILLTVWVITIVVEKIRGTHPSVWLLDWVSYLCFFSSHVQFFSLFHVVCSAGCSGGTSQLTVLYLLVTAFLVLFDAWLCNLFFVYDEVFLAGFAYTTNGGKMRQFIDFDFFDSYLNVDMYLQLLITVLLSGILSTLEPIASFESLADVGFALADKRVTVCGHTNNDSHHCIASFPGKYSEEWDQAMSVTSKNRKACSLACVFLTDKASGLGEHAPKPDLPGGCWCHTIYGRFTADTYFSIVEQDSCSQQELFFKRADAHAMGQLFLLKPPAHVQDELNQTWIKKLESARREAGELCNLNDGKAPWGCLWLEKWIKNIELAKILEQRIHVFYFKGKKGKGKVAWHQLNDKQAVEEARKDSGLGASQTVEVAYLENEGVDYEEHDMTEFEQFMKEHGGR